MQAWDRFIFTPNHPNSASKLDVEFRYIKGTFFNEWVLNSVCYFVKFDRPVSSEARFAFGSKC